MEVNKDISDSVYLLEYRMFDIISNLLSLRNIKYLYKW